MTEPLLTLLPMPRQITVTSGTITLPAEAIIAISHRDLFGEGQLIQRTLRDQLKTHWPLIIGTAANGLHLIRDETFAHPQGYELHITENSIRIRGHDAAGVFYGICTLRQLIAQHGRYLPALHISDWPDYPVRGVMLDVSRDKVPSMPTLYALVERLAGWKINQLQLYMEHTFAYSQHPTVWAEASPFTGQEILELDAFCRQRHIQLVPNQNSLGHMERWLKHEQYKPLAECPDGFVGDFGDHMGERRPATSLNPIDPASIDLMAGLYAELLPYFGGDIFNIGGDEPWEMGQCRSKAEIEKRGRGRVYVDYLLKIKQLVQQHDRRMMFWADVIMKYPELVSAMGQDVIALEWGYSADHPYSAHCPAFASSGVPFYVCPGTSGWNSISGRTANALDNLLDAASTGLQYGASGYLITDWGDRGHWQPLPVSYLGFAYGAGISWALAANRNMDVPRVLDTFVFEDNNRVMGRLAYDLGNIYKAPGLSYPNGHLLFFVLQMSEKNLQTFISNLDSQVVKSAKFGLIPATLQRVLADIESIITPLSKARMQCDDAALIGDEFQQAANLLRHACQRGMTLCGDAAFKPDFLLTDLEALIAQQRLNWLARNRPGGLRDSLLRFEPVMSEYRAQAGHIPSYL